MSAGSFEKNSFGWQLVQLQQRVQEWWELKTSHASPNLQLPSWFNSPLFWNIAKAVFWLILIILVIWVISQLWQWLRPYVYTLRKVGQRTEDGTQKTKKEISATGWLQRSQKFKTQGNYREACRCLYMAMLQRLNDVGSVPHQVSRTDGEYWQLIDSLPQPIPYQTLLTTHELLYFGNAEATPSVFEECEQAYREIEAISK
ncbi:MAG TPA: DUF4129 domain-containing protein [Kamptonema sp.]|nr:DUF4129 domain-containing protein [Kamptonema sp.]